MGGESRGRQAGPARMTFGRGLVLGPGGVVIMHSVNVEIEVDLPDGVTVHGYERRRRAHLFEIDFELPERCVCPKCRREADMNVRLKNEVLTVRDLDLFGQPTFWVYQPPMHQRPHSRQRTRLPTPFKRPRAIYTYRFEE